MACASCGRAWISNCHDRPHDVRGRLRPTAGFRFRSAHGRWGSDHGIGRHWETDQSGCGGPGLPASCVGRFGCGRNCGQQGTGEQRQANHGGQFLYPCRQSALGPFHLQSQQGIGDLDRPWKRIAEEIGLTHESIYRALATLQAQGRILREPDSVVLISPSGD